MLASGVDVASARIAAPTAESRPNIVVMMTDDQTVESIRVMHNLRRLLQDRGATFANSFVGLAQCCPSRATFLTGQYAHNHGVLGNEPPDGGYTKLDHSNTLAVWLQEAGYNTIHIGKYLNGYGLLDPTEIPPGWTEWRGSVDPSTYRYFGYTLNENGKLATYDHTYQTDLYARKATNVIRRRGPQAAPFFLWIAFLAPHSGRPRESDDPRGLGTPAPAPRHRDAFTTKDLPRPPSFNEADVSDKPFEIRRRSLLGSAQIRKIQENYQQRLESLLAVDEAVAKIVRALREAGELTNTLIVFTSDNGFFHGEHRVPAGKLLLYEPSIRVPLVMRGPGIPAGLRLTQHVSNIDLAPTIAEAASATPGRAMDGLSLLPLFTDSTASLERDLLVERLTGDFVFAALRTRGYLYAEHGNGERELYDFARDRHQLESKHADPAYAAIQADLAARLDRLRTCAAETCRTRP
jgi:arylsulfatase A-like enzyme